MSVNSPRNHDLMSRCLVHFVPTHFLDLLRKSIGLKNFGWFLLTIFFLGKNATTKHSLHCGDVALYLNPNDNKRKSNISQAKKHAAFLFIFVVETYFMSRTDKRCKESNLWPCKSKTIRRIVPLELLMMNPCENKEVFSVQDHWINSQLGLPGYI